MLEHLSDSEGRVLAVAHHGYFTMVSGSLGHLRTQSQKEVFLGVVAIFLVFKTNFFHFKNST